MFANTGANLRDSMVVLGQITNKSFAQITASNDQH